MDVPDLQRRIDALPRVRLAHLPTPIDACANLSRQLGRDISIKRDDCTGLGLGGNKVRQHEFILGAAVAAGADCLIQGAASQSNHARQLAAAGARLGLDVYLLPKADRWSSPIQGNYLIDHLTGAHIAPIDVDASSTERKTELAEQLRAQGRRPYIVGMGSQDATTLAAIAYVNAFLEIVRDGPAPRWIVTTSQGSTQVGLQLAAEALGAATTVIGICPLGPDHEAYLSPDEIADVGRSAAEALGLTTDIDASAIRSDTGFVGEGYGIPSDQSRAAVRRLATTEGTILDPIYTGKGFAGLLDLIDRGEIPEGDNVMFVHTGGVPLVFLHADYLSAPTAKVGADA